MLWGQSKENEIIKINYFHSINFFLNMKRSIRLAKYTKSFIWLVKFFKIPSEWQNG